MSNENYNELSYKPHFKFEKDISTLITDENTVDDVDAAQRNNSSEAYNQLVNNTVSSVILQLNILLINIDDYLNSLTFELQQLTVGETTFNNYTNALVSGDESITEPYLEYHRTNLLGVTGVEVYTKMYNLKLETDNLMALTTSIIYGENGISYEDAMAAEQLKFNKILEYENSDKQNLINYSTIVTDTMINYVLKNHTDILRGYAEGLFAISVGVDTGDKVAVREETKVTMEKFFDDSVIRNEDYIKNLDTILSTNTVQESMKSAFLQRQNIVNAVALQSDLQNLPDANYTGLLKTKVDEAIEVSLAKIFDFNKSVQQSDMYRVDYVSTLSEKNDIRTMYKSFK